MGVHRPRRHPDVQLLTPMPRRDPADRHQVAVLLEVTHWVRRVGLDLLVAACAVFNVGMAAVLAFAHNPQIDTSGTRPALELASRYVWAVGFAIAAALILVVLATEVRWIRPAAWILAFAVGGGWATSLLIATYRGEGTAVGAWLWVFLYAMWAVVAVLHSLDRG